MPVLHPKRFPQERTTIGRMRTVKTRGNATLVAIAAFSVWTTAVSAQNRPVAGAGTIPRSLIAIGYAVGSGSIKVDLNATGLMAGVHGEARVEAKQEGTVVHADIHGLTSTVSLGTEFLTYVLWAVSPENEANNMGEILFDKNGRARLSATIQLRIFSLLLTAEPYSSVRLPSEMLVLENALPKDAQVRIYAVNNYPLMKRTQYQTADDPLALSLDVKNVILEIYEARNAVDIAKSHGAEQYSPNVFSKAQAVLEEAESALARKARRTEIISLARQAAQYSEDARILAAERQ